MFVRAVASNPFLCRWNTAWVSSGYPLGAVPGDLSEYRRFARLALKEGRQVYWIRKGGPRGLVQEAVVRNFKKGKKGLSGRKLKTRGDIISEVGKDFVVLAIRPDISVARLRRSLSRVLNKNVVTITLTQVKDMWTDFQIYDKHVNLGKSYRELCQEYYPGKTDFRMVNGDWYYLSKIRFRCNYAKRLMSPDRFVPSVLSQVV
jgi:hypothetical protein